MSLSCYQLRGSLDHCSRSELVDLADLHGRVCDIAQLHTDCAAVSKKCAVVERKMCSSKMCSSQKKCAVVKQIYDLHPPGREILSDRHFG